MSPRIAIIVSGIYSPLCGAIEFSKRAEALGYQIRFFAPQKSAALLAFAKLDHQNIPHPKVDTRSSLLPPSEDNRADAAPISDRLNSAIAALGVDALLDDLRSYDPDLIFVDCELHAHIIVALSTGKPVVQYSSMFLSPPSLQAPPLHKRSFPGRGLRGSKFGIALLWTRHYLWKASKIRRNRRRDRGADHPTALLELARRLDVPIKALRRFNCWQIPWTYKLPTALFLPRALDLPTKPYADMKYLGPMILKDRPKRDTDDETIAEFCAASDGRKRIFLSFGSMMAPDARLIPKLWDIASRHPEWRLLCAAGENWSASARREVPENVGGVEWVPQQKVLQHADLAIIHGGTASLVEAVDAATPMLVIPHVNDQKGSAARVVYHGLGRAIFPKDPVDAIEAAIVDLLQDRQTAENCLSMQSACQREEEALDLNTYLRGLLAQHS